MSNFTFSPTDIPGVQIIDVKSFGDARGYFMETYRAADFAAAGITDAFVQDNQSCSHRGVLRGLHFQKQHQQAKLVRAICGEIFDVAVDLRRGSATYGRWVGVLLSADNRRQLVMFPDVSSRHWAYYQVLEAANAHTAILTDPETWDK